jgi:hypothetical protein
MPGITVPSDWGGTESGWGAALTNLGSYAMDWGQILYKDARDDAAEKKRLTAIKEAYGKLIDQPSSGEMGDAPPVYGPPEPPVYGPPEAGQMGVSQGPQRAEDPIASLRRQTLEGEALLAASAPELIDEYRAAAGERLRQAELERDSKLIAPVLSQTRAQLGPDNKAAEAQIGILVEGLRRGDLDATQVRAGLLALSQEHTARLNQAALDDEFSAVVNALAVDPRFNMYEYRSGTHDQESYQGGAFGNVKLLGELAKITSDMPPAKRNQFYRAIAGAQSEGVAQVMIETQKENRALKAREEATKAALRMTRQGPPVAAAGQPAPSPTGTPAAPAAMGAPGPSAGPAPAAGVSPREWMGQDRFPESGAYSKHDNAMYTSGAQQELRDAIAGIGMDGDEQSRAAALEQALQSWSSKHGVRFDDRQQVADFLAQDIEAPDTKSRVQRVIADALDVNSHADLVQRAAQAETAAQAVKDLGDRFVAGVLGAWGAAADDPIYQQYAMDRMAEKDTVRKLYDAAADKLQAYMEGKALDAAAWYMRDNNAVRKAAKELSGYVSEVADGYGSLIDTGSEIDARRQAKYKAQMRAQEKRQAQRRQPLEEQRDAAQAAAAAAAQRSAQRQAEQGAAGPSPAMQEADALRDKQARVTQDIAQLQSQLGIKPRGDSVEAGMEDLRAQITQTRKELAAAGSGSREEVGRRLRMFMRLKQKYAESGMVRREVIDAVGSEIEKLRTQYRRTAGN